MKHSAEDYMRSVFGQNGEAPLFTTQAEVTPKTMDQSCSELLQRISNRITSTGYKLKNVRVMPSDTGSYFIIILLSHMDVSMELERSLITDNLKGVDVTKRLGRALRRTLKHGYPTIYESLYPKRKK